MARGETTTAEHHFRTDLSIVERLAAADPGNADYQRDPAPGVTYRPGHRRLTNFGGYGRHAPAVTASPVMSSR